MEAIPMGCIETELDETIMPKTQHKEEIHYVENEEKAHRDHDSVGFDGVLGRCRTGGAGNRTVGVPWGMAYR